MKRLLTGLALVGCAWSAQAYDTHAIVDTYANIALAGYEDSLSTARTMQEAIQALIDKPGVEALHQARQAWVDARVPYMQTEAFRFGNPLVDAWEGRVNAWPLDEGLIDYVDASYGTETDANPYYTVNVIANPVLRVGGRQIDASRIDAALLSGTLHEIGGQEANVASGYHAIEFLLWGQDLNGTEAGAGDRPYTDFDSANCTGGNCDRRVQYLLASTELLIADLSEMVDYWKQDGQARTNLLSKPDDAAISTILTGLGSLSYGELAGERMKLGLMLHDPEEEHDCFSDNTHNAHYYDQIGIRNVYLGSYKRVDGSMVKGPSLSDAVRETAAELDTEMRTRLSHTVDAMQKIRDRAAAGEAYDQQIGAGNTEGNATVQAAIDALVTQTRSIERVVAQLNLSAVSVEGSDSLDQPNAVFH